MTKELFFLCGAPAPLHDAAAELRRAGYLVKQQPQDLDGVWSLQAVNGQFVVPAGGQVKVPGPGVVQLFVTGVVPFVRAWRMR